LLVAFLAACPPALADPLNQPTAPNDASDDTPARRAPATIVPSDSGRELDPGPGGAILNPFLQQSEPATQEVVVAANAPDEASSTLTVVAVLGGLAVAALLLRSMLNAA
jgi:hypothetical protein